VADAPAPLRLIVRRRVKGAPERAFRAWTDPQELRRWWGPRPVECAAAEIDLRAGGRYRIANRFPDGRVLWIAGEFERIVFPRLLAFSWYLEPAPENVSRVTVRFEPHGDGTEVVVVHERIPDEAVRSNHEQGWLGCLTGLELYLAQASPLNSRP
jgi:uncharacterized protein YndB with AHSA1/START domain